jgi:hypothetical protein
MGTRSLVHIIKCCGTCSMWAGSRDVACVSPNPKYPIPIKVDESKAHCYNLGAGSSTLFGPGQQCGKYSPMFR